MSGDALSNEDIWARFLSKATYGTDYEALVHCTDEVSCNRSVARSDIFRVIPTAPSEYCENLVDPMLALLSEALQGAGSPKDKFVFVSDTSVPLKPFSEVQQYLLKDDISHVCFASTTKACGALLKAGQWSSYSRRHAAELVAKQGSVPKRLSEMVPEQNKFTCLGCTDEFWPATVLFGNKNTFRAAEQSMERVYGARTSCLMYEDWEAFHDGKTNSVHPAGTRGFYQTDLGIRTVHRANRTTATGPYGPATITSMSQESLLAFRRSSFLFARKVVNTTVYLGPQTQTLAEAFEEFVFN